MVSKVKADSHYKMSTKLAVFTPVNHLKTKAHVTDHICIKCPEEGDLLK